MNNKATSTAPSSSRSATRSQASGGGAVFREENGPELSSLVGSNRVLAGMAASGSRGQGEVVQAKSAPAPASVSVVGEAPSVGGAEPSADFARGPEVGASGGQELPGRLRSQMEAAFGHDFSDVRIHRDGRAQRMGALAFTQGNRIHFQPHRFDPSSNKGRELIGHELAHVVQQREGRVAMPSGKGSPVNANPALEREADLLGAAAARGSGAGRPRVAEGARARMLNGGVKAVQKKSASRMTVLSRAPIQKKADAPAPAPKFREPSARDFHGSPDQIEALREQARERAAEARRKAQARREAHEARHAARKKELARAGAERSEAFKQRREAGRAAHEERVQSALGKARERMAGIPQTARASAPAPSPVLGGESEISPRTEPSAPAVQPPSGDTAPMTDKPAAAIPAVPAASAAEETASPEKPSFLKRVGAKFSAFKQGLAKRKSGFAAAGLAGLGLAGLALGGPLGLALGAAGAVGLAGHAFYQRRRARKVAAGKSGGSAKGRKGKALDREAAIRAAVSGGKGGDYFGDSLVGAPGPNYAMLAALPPEVRDRLIERNRMGN